MHNKNAEVLNSVLVKDAMMEIMITVSKDTTVRKLAHVIQVTDHIGFPVLNSKKTCRYYYYTSYIRNAF